MDHTPDLPPKNPKSKMLASNLTLQKLSKRPEKAVKSSTSSNDSEQSILNSGETLYNIQHEFYRCIVSYQGNSLYFKTDFVSSLLKHVR